jgi:alpha-tubulin suppressor-like RCC1 family protein
MHHTCGLRGGTPACWGVGDYGNLALGDDTGAARDAPADVAPPAPFASIALGGFFTCGLTADGRLWCAGLDSSGQLGTGEGGDRLAPAALGGAEWTAVTTGANHSCARAASGELACWGYNAAGQLGDGTIIPRQVPTPIPDAGGGVPAGGTLHTCEIRPDGSLWCWGHNQYGQLGQGDTAPRSGKVRVQPGSTWLRVATANHTCGIQADNTLWCWGRNANYTIGNNNNTDVLSPALVTTASPPDTFLAVAVSETHTCAIKTNSRVWCWGLNDTGQAGTGNTMPAQTPQPTIGVDVDRVAIGRNHTCVRRMSGHALACWGDNASGQIGDGTRTRRLQATDIAGTRAWAVLAAGRASTCAIEEPTGVLHCWGLNTSGQVGDGSVDDRLAPTPVRPDLAWTAVEPSGFHTCGLAAGGALHCWGDGGVGGVGDGTAWRSTLVEVR